MSNVIIASSKEEKEKLLNIRIEQIKKKNAELINKHKLIEEDKRLAELQGRSMKNKPSGCEDTEVDNKRKINSTKKESLENVKYQTSKPPLEPSYNFLFDKMRDESQKEDRKERTRRHPRNYGGINFEDVPRKIQQERARQNNQRRHWRPNEVDYMLITTGKERREMDEWRKEREEIDKRRMQRQKKEDGGWKREWDQNKDSLFVNSDNSSGARSNSGDQKYFAKMWTGGGSQRHYNKIYHQKRKVKRNISDSSCASTIFQERNDGSKTPQGFSKKDSRVISDSSEQQHCSIGRGSSSEDLNRFKNSNGQPVKDSWRSWKMEKESVHRKKNEISKNSSHDPPTQLAVTDETIPSSSPRKSVKFLDVEGTTKESRKKTESFVENLQPVRTGRNFVGSGRFSGGQKLRTKGHRHKREFNTRSLDQPYHPKYGNQIRKVYLDEAMCKSIEVISSPSGNRATANQEVKTLSLREKEESHESGDDRSSIKPDGLDKKSEDEYGDEDEQWEDIDEEVCLELDHGREETIIDASSESLDQFIMNNTLTLDTSESLSNNVRTLETSKIMLLDRSDTSMGPEGSYPSVLDWEDDVESISQLSDVEKCNVSDSSVESSNFIQSCSNGGDNDVVAEAQPGKTIEDGEEKALIKIGLSEDFEQPLLSDKSGNCLDQERDVNVGLLHNIILQGLQID